MKSDPKDCLYCQNNETLHNLMIEIAPLSVSRVFLFKERADECSALSPRPGRAEEPPPLQADAEPRSADNGRPTAAP